MIDADDEIYLASENEEISKNEERKEPHIKHTSPKTFAVREIVEKRRSNRKVYKMNDGSERAEIFASNVHFFNKDTQMFEECDSVIFEDETGKFYTNRIGDFRTKFSNEENDDEIFSIEKDNHKIRVSLKKKKSNINRKSVPRLHKCHINNCVKDKLVYNDIDEGVAFEYSVDNNGVKENIIIKSKSNVYRYSFIIDCENLVPNYIESEKRIIFSDPETSENIFEIPAPYMFDANGKVSHALMYELKNTKDGRFSFSVTADSNWINSDERVFPVCIDPQINTTYNAIDNENIFTYSWSDGWKHISNECLVGTSHTEDDCKINRMYIHIKRPNIPSSANIKKAEIILHQAQGVRNGNSKPFGLYLISYDELGETIFNTLLDVNTFTTDDQETSYAFDVTSIFNKAHSDIKDDYVYLAVRGLDEDNPCDDNTILSVENLTIEYKTSYAINTAYKSRTYSVGNVLNGAIGLERGNLTLELNDFVWSGNRMPVTLQHLYNSNLSECQYTNNSAIDLNVADFEQMKVGLGWKLNVMQSIAQSEVYDGNVKYSGYVYVDANHEEYYLKPSEKVRQTVEGQNYHLYEDTNGSEIYYDDYKRTLEIETEIYRFDTKGRLISITDEHNNSMDIYYTNDRISSVTDGAGRDFDFAYNENSELESITAPDNTIISYQYDEEGKLIEVKLPDYRLIKINNGCIELCDPNGDRVQKIEYTIEDGRVINVAEYGEIGDDLEEDVRVNYAEFDYYVGSRKTIVTTTTNDEDSDTGEYSFKTSYTFDNNDDLVSEYSYTEEYGNVGVDGEEESGINPYIGENGMSINCSIDNFLVDHRFNQPINATSSWRAKENNSANFSYAINQDESIAEYGKKYLSLISNKTDVYENGIFQETIPLNAGTYTFSVYVSVTSDFAGVVTPGAFIRVLDKEGNELGRSEYLSTTSSPIERLVLPFELHCESRESVRVEILVNGKGIVRIDSAQLENNVYANKYNMLLNGNFELGNIGWGRVKNFQIGNKSFNMRCSGRVVGDVLNKCGAKQGVDVKSICSTVETFTLSGWANACSLSNRRENNEYSPTFRLRALIEYSDGATEEHTADFAPYMSDWQYSSVSFSKSQYKDIKSLTVYCDYDYNTGLAFFDDIQLVRDSIETGVTEEDFDGTNVDDEEVNSSATNAFKEIIDKFGNTITETTFDDNKEFAIYGSFGYRSECNCVETAGNDLIKETDARGNSTFYTVDEYTSRNEEVIDRLGNKTAYEYDNCGRTTKVTSKRSDGVELANVSYAYDSLDNMTEIVRGDGMKYVLEYNNFHNLESIGIDGKNEKLIKYTYKNGNGRLKRMTYANGHTMTATYNSLGQMIAEKWYMSELDADTPDATPTAYYQYVYDGQGNIVKSIDNVAAKEYNYIYDEGKLIASFEYNICPEIVKELVSSVKYRYSKEGVLISKHITFADGTTRVINYTNTDSGTEIEVDGIKFTSDTDDFGRKTFDGSRNFIYRNFEYHDGVPTPEHKLHGKDTAKATTQLVSKIQFSNGRTITYGYDAEERINLVLDSANGITSYTYDALGQLLTEYVNAYVVNSMEYDNYGNIIKKNGKVYTYGDEKWKDLLTGFDGKTIEYDAQGNPVQYLGHTLTWEKGRQLKSFDNNTYTYNANGIRTSKTIRVNEYDAGVTHTYTLDRTKILRETWEGNTLIPIYDNEDSICGIIYNNVRYYFLKNLQGDIIEIVDEDAITVAKYSYDAWGVPTIISDISECKIATINPFRYRGYYYDQEIELYYLQSRYYDMDIGRFINVDSALLPYLFQAYDTNFNIFSYCCCNPINGSDANGYLYISYSQLNGFIAGVMWSMKWLNGWKQVGAVLKFYLPALLAWINSLPVMGQVLFCLIVACVAWVALEFAYAYYVKKCGIDISASWKGIKIYYR